MKKRTALTLATITLVTGIYVNSYGLPQVINGSQHSFKYTENVPLVEPEYVDYQAVIDALSSEAQIVGLTGQTEKTVKHESSKWYGSRAYTMTIHGEFKMGIDTEDIQISTNRNTITVKFPQPKLISADFPFDKATIGKDVGLLRKNLSDEELQFLYGKARESAIEEIKSDESVKSQSVIGIEKAIDGLLNQIHNVDEVNFELESKE